MRLPTVCLCLLSLLPTGLAEASPGPPDLRSLLPGEIVGWKASGRDRIFSRGTVHRYLGGESEGYLAYAFRGLVVRGYSGGNRASLVAEVFDMSKAADAYGVFSGDQEGEPVAVGEESFYHEGLLRFWKGPYFVRLRAGAATPEIRSVLIGLGLRIAARVPAGGPRPRIVSCLPREGLERGSVRFFHRQNSLNAYYYLADENVLLLDNTTEVALARYRAGWSVALALVCRYPGAAVAGRAFARFRRDYFSTKLGPGVRSVVEEIEYGEWAAARLRGDVLLIVLEAPDRAHCESLLEGVSSGVEAVFGRR
jgi:hypothetical protein